MRRAHSSKNKECSFHIYSVVVRAEVCSFDKNTQIYKRVRLISLAPGGSLVRIIFSLQPISNRVTIARFSFYKKSRRSCGSSAFICYFFLVIISITAPPAIAAASRITITTVSSPVAGQVVPSGMMDVVLSVGCCVASPPCVLGVVGSVVTPP